MALVIPNHPFGIVSAVDDAAFRKLAQHHCQQHYRGREATNRHSGDVVNLTMAGIKHSLHAARPPLMRALSLLPQIVEEALKTGELRDKFGRPDIVKVHKYEIDLIDAGSMRVGLIVVRETRQGVKNFYDLGFLAR